MPTFALGTFWPDTSLGHAEAVIVNVGKKGCTGSSLAIVPFPKKLMRVSFETSSY
jgi:hypothetical protein